jgi:hypothetical protein
MVVTIRVNDIFWWGIKWSEAITKQEASLCLGGNVTMDGVHGSFCDLLF